MENGEEKEKKTNTNNKRLRLRNTLVSFMLFLISFVIVVTYQTITQDFSSPSTIQTAISNFLFKTQSFSTLTFNKISQDRNGLRVATVNRFGMDNNQSMTYFTFNEHTLFISSGISVVKDTKTVEFKGSLEKIEFYYISPKSPLLYDPNTTINENLLSKCVIGGYFVFCQYNIGKRRMLSCLLIPNAVNEINSNISVNKFSKKEQTDHKSNNVKIGANLDSMQLLFDIDIGEKVFLGLIYNHLNEMQYTLGDNKNISLNFYGMDCAFTESKKMSHPFISNINIGLFLSSLSIFDGEILTIIDIENNSPHIFSSKHICNYSQANSFHYINESEDRVMVNGFHLEDEKKEYDIYWSPENKAFNVYNNKSYNSTYSFQSIGLPSLDDKYEILNRCYYPWESYPNKFGQENNIFYLGFFVTLEKQKDSGEISVLFHDGNNCLQANTQGIDEPVDEAHVTYEDGKLTIYFMNKNSIYRWQNSEVGIGNLKLRELDLKPEPLQTKTPQ